MVEKPVKWMPKREGAHALNPDKANIQADKWCTICDVHRRLYRLVRQAVEPEDPVTALKLKSLIAEAYDLGKRMDRKLRARDPEYWRDIWEPGRPENVFKEE